MKSNLASYRMAAVLLANHDVSSASTHLDIALPELQSDGSKSFRSTGWLLVARLTQKALDERRTIDSDQAQQTAPTGTETAESPVAQAPDPASRATSRDRASIPRYIQRRIAPELMTQGLPGPVGTWIRRPRPGEGQAISDLLEHADDELAPWTVEAINSCTLSSALAGMLSNQPLEELATELVRGGRETFMPGLTIVLVAVTPDRKLIGAIQASPPFHLLGELGNHGVSAAQQRAGAAFITTISGIAVAPPHRSNGIGRALTSSVLDLSWRLGRQLVSGLRRVPELPRFVWHVTDRTKSPC